MELYGTLWNFMELCATLCNFSNFMELYGNLWSFVELYGTLGNFMELFSPSCLSVRPHAKIWISNRSHIYCLPYITGTLYYVNVKLFVDPAFSFDINKRHFVFTKVFSKSYWPHIILLDLGVASWIRVLSVRFQLLSLRLQLTLHHLLNKYRDPIKHQPRREKPAENTSVAQLSPSLFVINIIIILHCPHAKLWILN